VFPCGKRKELPSKCFLDCGHSKQEKISNLFFFSFHDLYRLPDPELLIYYLLPEWKTASGNLYTVIGISPYLTIPHILFVYFLPTFQCYAVGTSYIYVIRSDTIKSISCESWNSTFSVCGEGENRFLNVRLDFRSLGLYMVDGGWELC